MQTPNKKQSSSFSASLKMPTITMPGALLALSAPCHTTASADGLQASCIPWCWPAWQQRTGLSSSPFSITVTEDTPSLWRLPDANQAVWTFVSNFWAIEDTMQVDYIKKGRSDNDAKGRELWLGFFHSKWSDWKVNSAIDAILIERSLDPYSIMKRMRLANVSFIYLYSYVAYSMSTY